MLSHAETKITKRGVVSGGAMAHPDFGRSINPISTRGTDYGHLITTGTPGFSDLPTALKHPHKIVKILMGHPLYHKLFLSEFYL